MRAPSMSTHQNAPFAVSTGEGDASPPALSPSDGCGSPRDRKSLGHFHSKQGVPSILGISKQLCCQSKLRSERIAIASPAADDLSITALLPRDELG